MFRRKSRAQKIISGLNGIVKSAARSPAGKDIKRAFRSYSRQLAAVKVPLKVTISR